MGTLPMEATIFTAELHAINVATQNMRAHMTFQNNLQSLLGMDCPAVQLIEYLIKIQILDEL